AQEASAKPWATWIEEQFPKALSQKHFVLRDYQWICLAIFVFLGFVADLATRTILNGLTTFWIRKVRAKIDYKVQKELWKPVGLLSQSLVWYGGTSLLALPSWILLILVVAVKFLTVVAAVWTAFRLIDLLANFLENKADKTETKFDNLLVHLLSRSLRIVAVCIGLVMFADIFELPWTGLLGGLGIGGAAIAFASKDVLGNFFGSLTVLSDRPFEIGDWVIMGDVEGSVETVGIRSTRIRTFYNSLIVVPNSTLVTATVDNMGQRRFRRVKAKLSLTYDTSPEKIDAFCEGVRELLRRHPYTRKDYYHVYLNELGESGLQILLYSFWECPDWSIELREKHRLYLDIIRLASKLGVEFAFPTSTLHLHQTENEAPRSALDLSDPQLTGKKAAAEITGPPMTGNARPGPVLFEGPADFPSS
ncbi:MAG: mechanosensitive ion channel family protein, partial [Pirellulaceae bacterium]|nr:mechanosensitive ion channel family protein [Pirellulaceae bacterium]